MSNEIETALLFQTKYRGRTYSGTDGDEDDEATHIPTPPVILPSGWGKRYKKASPVYTYDATERMTYNEIQYMHGPEEAKAWADRRWHERDRK